MSSTRIEAPGDHAAPADLARANRALRMLSDSNQALIRTADETTLLHKVCRIAVETGGYRMAWIGFAEADEHKTVRPAAVAGFDAGYLESAGFTWGEGTHGQGPAATAIRTGEPCILRDLQSDPAYAPWREAARARGYLSAIALPLTDQKRTFGVLKVYSADASSFDAQEVQILMELAGDVAFGVVTLRIRAERDAATATLKATARQLHTLVESLPDFISRFDREGRYTYVNPRVIASFGTSMEAVRGKRPADLPSGMDADTAAKVQEALLAAIEEGRSGAVDAVFQTAQGPRSVEVRYVPEIDEHGQVAGVLGIARDFTEQRAAEESLRQAQKMEAVGRLAGGVAHDFNNVLAVVHMQSDLLLDDPTLTDDTREGVHQIMEAAERAANLTRQLLTFSRRDVSRPRHIDLGEVLTTLVKMLRRVLGEDIQLVADVAPSLPLVHADAGMMEQVILNLAINARDAMPGGGSLTLQVDAVDVSAETAALHPGATPGRHLRLSAVDTGLGIAPEHIPRIFEPFFTTKEVGRGTGLGLATVFGIVERHRGFLEVESALGHGARFRVFLPASREAPSGGRTVSQRAPMKAGFERILLVEDEPMVRALAQTVLERKGYLVVEAENADAALVAWERERGAFDLLLTDLVMPGSMTGHKLAEILRARAPELKILCCSGYSSDTVDRVTPAGKYAFLQKPYSASDLTTAVRQCLDARDARR